MLAENYKIVPVIADSDIATADQTGDSINMENYHKATFIVITGTMAGGDATIRAYGGLTDAATTTALTFNYAWGGATAAAANCDVLAAWTSGTSVTLAHATHDNYMLVMEVDAAQMAGSSYPWLTWHLAAGGATTGHISVIAILEPRYQSNRIATALA